MKNLKKFTAILTAMLTVIAMSVPVMAATKPTASDAATATVSNVEADATVTAYQIVKADYNDYGFTGYSAATGVTLADVTAPTSTEITTIAKAINDGSLTLTSKSMSTTATEGLAQFTANLEPGYWVVLVDGNVKEVYNPMLVGVYYSVSGIDNTMVTGPVDANTNWTLVTANAYAKSTDPTVEKTIVDPGSGNDKGDDVAIGDTVNFQIDTVIPSYSKQYTEVIVKISDTLSAGLELDEDSVVVDGLTKNTDYTITTTASGFVITIVSEYALAHGGEALKVNYSATLTDEAGINFDANTNTATLEYSNDPTDSEKTKTKDDITYHYTFGIDAKLGGSSEDEWNQVTEELIKGETVKVTEEGGTVEKFEPLAGATFTLTNDDTGKVYTATSDDDGYLNFEGLDAGEYTLVETVPPDGYTLNDQEIPVVITATYNEDGTLASYTITVNGVATSTYSATYTGEGTSTELDTVTIDESETTNIYNTKLNELPSTGGMGTYLFTMAGVAIISVAAILLYVNNKKKA